MSRIVELLVGINALATLAAYFGVKFAVGKTKQAGRNAVQAVTGVRPRYAILTNDGDRYNSTWRVYKDGFATEEEAREASRRDIYQPGVRSVVVGDDSHMYEQAKKPARRLLR